jgi:hypothetical protein
MEPSIEPLIEQMLAYERAQKDKARVGDRRSSLWARPALAVGSLVIGAGVLGGTLGMSAIGGPDTDQSVAVQLPPARLRPASSSAGPAVAATEAEPRGLEAVPVVRAEVATQRHRPLAAARPSSAMAEGPPVEDKVTVEAEPTSSETIAPDPLAPAPEGAALSAARMPLPGHVVARTIRRIGYRCDQVASTTAIADGQGAFMVTCSSGESYRASPVRGRYHFRRMAAR